MNDNPGIAAALETILVDQQLVWDAPTRVYQVNGPSDDPIFSLLVEIGAHPIDILTEAFSCGYTIDSDAIGIAITTEGWCAISYDELLETSPETLEEVIELGTSVFGFDETALREASRDAWTRITTTIPPSSLPENLRHEVRTALTVLRDGGIVFRSQIRGKDVDSSDHFAGGAVAEALGRFLKGQHPVPPPKVEPVKLPTLGSNLFS